MSKAACSECGKDLSSKFPKLASTGKGSDKVMSPDKVMSCTSVSLQSELVCRVKYNNNLPDIPFDPKFITYPFETNRFVQYNPTSLERSYKHDLLTEHDLGVTIDLINPDTYRIDPNAFLQQEDERLLEEEVNTPQDSKRSRHHKVNVSWLRKTEYISTEYNRFTPSSDKAESKVGYSIKKYFKEEDLYRDRESQIKAIESTFDAAKTQITKHYSKPNVTPVQVLPVFPDFDLWKFPCAQVIFDADPAPVGHSQPAQMEEMSQAMIRGMVDESGDQFVAYFLPTEENLSKRKRDTEAGMDYEENEEYEYKLAREYNWTVKNKASRGYEESYFFVLRDDGVYYNELETKVRLSKRRKLGTTSVPNTTLVVKHRPPNEPEIAAQDVRLAVLEPPAEEEEEVQENVLEAEAEKSGEEEIAERSGGEEVAEGSGDEERDRETKERERESGSESEGERSNRSGSVSPRSGSGRSRSGSESRSGSGSGSGSDSGSGSESGGESDAEDEKKKEEEEIFGSASSDED